MKPIEGAETGGAVGFFKGVGKGLVGFVITSQDPDAITMTHNLSKQRCYEACGRCL
jgi:hypothetical protein